MITIKFVGDTELLARFDALPDNIRAAVAEKLEQLTEMLRQKVVDNVSGKVLQKRSGDLASRIQSEVDTASIPMTGFVGPNPSDAKAWVLEYGGKGWYDIFPVKASVLRFVSKSGDLVFAKYVNHPPGQPFYYLRSALVEMADPVVSGFYEALEKAIQT